MNAKKAKMLRRIAREQIVGSPDRAYESVALNKQKVNRQTIRLTPSTRLVYKELKRAYKKGA